MFPLPTPFVRTPVIDPDVSPGRARLEFVRDGSRTVVTRAFAASPLRLLTPANHGHAAWVYTSSYGGGLVDGDRLAMTISVERDASAVLSTQASTKVYRSPRGTTSELMGRIEEGGTLLVLPDPVVCFAGARYCQRQRVRMSERASLVIADCMLSGRRAAGERWRFVDYRSLLEIIVGSRLLVHDSMALREADGELVRRFGRINALATVAIVGPHFCEHAARLVTWSAAQEVTPASELVITASNLSDQGCVVRIAGSSGENVWRSVKTVLNFIPPWLGDDPWARKW